VAVERGAVSSSGTRLTDVFRCLPDMINCGWSGWFRVAVGRAGSRGRGQGSGGSPTAQRRGLDAANDRLILSVAGAARSGWRAQGSAFRPNLEIGALRQRTLRLRLWTLRQTSLREAQD
jgi:hypothetical protein